MEFLYEEGDYYFTLEGQLWLMEGDLCQLGTRDGLWLGWNDWRILSREGRLFGEGGYEVVKLGMQMDLGDALIRVKSSRFCQGPIGLKDWILAERMMGQR
jgi:hypothetical protein